MAHKSTAWYQRHANDAHVKKAQREGKRSRAVYKLAEILDQHLPQFAPQSVVVDLGCAPGSWSEEIVSRLNAQGLLVGIDLLPVEHVQGATILQCDFTTSEGQDGLAKALNGRVIDLIVSDMAPEMSGNKLVDQMRMIGLNELTLHFSDQHLRVGGHLLLKTFMGDGFDGFRRSLGERFKRVKSIKPAASRKDSSEFFLLALDKK